MNLLNLMIKMNINKLIDLEEGNEYKMINLIS